MRMRAQKKTMTDYINRADLIAHLEELQTLCKDPQLQLFWDGVIFLIRRFPGTDIANDDYICRSKLLAKLNKTVCNRPDVERVIKNMPGYGI